jgi:hypothetical protein
VPVKNNAPVPFPAPFKLIALVLLNVPLLNARSSIALLATVVLLVLPNPSVFCKISLPALMVVAPV